MNSSQRHQRRLHIEAEARAAGPWTAGDERRADTLRRLVTRNEEELYELAVLRQREITEAIRLRRLMMKGKP